MNVMTVLKSEISRSLRKEAKAIGITSQKASATYRGLIAGLRKQVAGLQRELAGLKRAMPKAERVLEGKPSPKAVSGSPAKASRR